MAKRKLSDLRHNYKVAYTDYMRHVRALSIASLQGEWLTNDAIHADEKAFSELSFARRALIDALLEHADGETKK